MATFARLPQIALVLTLGVWVSAERAVCGDDTVAAKYVRLALAHEAHGRQEFRQHFLDAALVASPDYAPAHWHLGHVQVDGKWVPAEESQEMAARDEALVRYSKLRDDALGDPRRELALARLAQKEQWEDRAELHLASVALNPSSPARIRAEAAKRLDLVNVQGALLTQEEAEQAKEVAERVESAIKTWRGRLEEWRQKIEVAGGPHRKAAMAEMANVDDPDIIPVTETFLRDSGALFGQQLIVVLGKFPQHDSTRTLARFAVLSPWENVRNLAIDELKHRPLHEYVPMLLDGLVAPIRSQFQITRSPEGVVHYKHLFVQHSPEGNYVSAKEHVSQPVVMRLHGAPDLDRRITDNESPLSAWVETQHDARLNTIRAAMEAARYEHALAERNIVVSRNNEPILRALESVTGQRLGAEPADWQSWWQAFNEVYTEKPTYYEYTPTVSTYLSYVQPRHSCFTAGTPVWTEVGLVPIERVKVGDRVLSQDPNSGELSYKVVLRTTASPPTTSSVRLMLNGELIEMTRSHVVWVADHGWRMAKELHAGDRLHGLEGVIRIEATEDLPPELEVYNLVVADFNTYFVGNDAVFVHDITYRKPTRAAVPGVTWDEEPGGTNRAIIPSLVRQIHSALQ